MATSPYRRSYGGRRTRRQGSQWLWLVAIAVGVLLTAEHRMASVFAPTLARDWQQPATADAATPAAIGPGHPLVTDGDTLRFGRQRVRLWGIDAPELHQRCPDRWLAGIEASHKMRELLKGHHVTCEDRGHDRFGRMIGLCRADGTDIQAAMVRAGMAWAFVRYSSDYVQEEARAKAERLGVFAHGCEPAWEWRAERR